jgi:hypothetical protein
MEMNWQMLSARAINSHPTNLWTPKTLSALLTMLDRIGQATSVHTRIYILGRDSLTFSSERNSDARNEIQLHSCLKKYVRYIKEIPTTNEKS